MVPKLVVMILKISLLLLVTGIHEICAAVGPIRSVCTFRLGFLGGSVVKNLPANAGDVGSSPGLGRSPGEGNSNHSSILAWRILWTEKPGRLQSTGLQRVGYN